VDVSTPARHEIGTIAHAIPRSRLPETDVAETEAWVADCLARLNCYNFVVEELHVPNPKVIGIVGAIRTPEVGYIFHKDSWGKGYATEALAAFMPLLWAHIDPVTAPEGRQYDYAEAFTDVENLSSRRVLEKCGFTLIEIRQKDFDNPAMGLRDTAVYRLPKPIENKDHINATYP
jgi:RimJ/RimL family protein N-acetyltransferase